jgi:hypothetical protein
VEQNHLLTDTVPERNKVERFWNRHIYPISKWYYYNFISHFLIYLPLPLMLLLLMGLLTDNSSSFGIDKLVWHDDPWKQGFVGCGCAFLVAGTLFVGYLLWQRDRDRDKNRGDKRLPQFRNLDFATYAWFIFWGFLIPAWLGFFILWLAESPRPQITFLPPILLLATVAGCWLVWLWAPQAKSVDNGNAAPQTGPSPVNNLIPVPETSQVQPELGKKIRRRWSLIGWGLVAIALLSLIGTWMLPPLEMEEPGLTKMIAQGMGAQAIAPAAGPLAAAAQQLVALNFAKVDALSVQREQSDYSALLWWGAAVAGGLGLVLVLLGWQLKKYAHQKFHGLAAVLNSSAVWAILSAGGWVGLLMLMRYWAWVWEVYQRHTEPGFPAYPRSWWPLLLGIFGGLLFLWLAGQPWLIHGLQALGRSLLWLFGKIPLLGRVGMLVTAIHNRLEGWKPFRTALALASFVLIALLGGDLLWISHVSRSHFGFWAIVLGALILIIAFAQEHFTRPEDKKNWKLLLKLFGQSLLLSLAIPVLGLIAYARMESNGLLPSDIMCVLGLSFTVGVAAVGAFLAWLIVPSKQSYRRLFVLSLMSNGVLVFVWYTWITSNLIQQFTGWNLLSFNLWLPFIFPLALTLVIGYSPNGAREFYQWWKDRDEKPEFSRAQVRAGYTGIAAFIGGWVLFLLMCALPLTTSPTLPVLALLFVLVATYGLVSYALRRTATMVIAVVAFLALLSGVNHYKFRFAGPLADLYNPEKHVRLEDEFLTPDNRKKDIEAILADEQKVIDDNAPAVQAFYEQHQKQESVQALLNARQGLLAEAGPFVKDLNEFNTLVFAEQASTLIAAPQPPFRLWEQVFDSGAIHDSLDAAFARAIVKNDAFIRINGVDNDLPLVDEVPAFAAMLEQLIVFAAGEEVNDFDAEAEALLAKLEPSKEMRDKARQAFKDIFYHNRLTFNVPFKTSAVMPLLFKSHDERKEFPLELGSVDFTTYGQLGGQKYEKSEKKPLIVIAVSGGGLRSAVWTFLVLSELESRFAKKGVDFPAHVRIITGASGGMLGAGYYTATLPHPAARNKTAHYDKDTGWRSQDLHQLALNLEKEAITPVMNQYVFGDMLHFFAPWPAKYDRGRAIEDAWKANLGNAWVPPGTKATAAMDVTFEMLHGREEEGWCPSLIFTPMIVEDGRRLIISNLNMYYPIANNAPLIRSDPNLRKGLLSIEGFELFRLQPSLRKDMPLSTAIRMSASFPFFSPAVSLPTVPRKRVVDAGYYDNYGVSIAASWLFSRTENIHWFKSNVSQICFIQIRDGVSDQARQLLELPQEKSSPFSRCLEEIFTPLEGLYTAKESSSLFRNDGQLEIMNFYLRGLPSPLDETDKRDFEKGLGDVFHVVNFEYAGQAKLNWYLSEAEVGDLRKKATEVVDRQFLPLYATLFDNAKK